MRFRFLLILIWVLSCGLPPAEKARCILNEGMKDESPIIRVNAAKGLAGIGDPRGIEFLYKTLNGDNKDATVAALGALYNLRENTLSPIVCKLCSSTDPLIRTEAIRLIASIRNEKCKEILLNHTQDKIAKIRKLSYLGLGKFKANNVIKDGLRDIDVYVRIAASQTLGKLGEAGMENFVRKELKVFNLAIWEDGILALAEMNDTSAITFIKGLFVDTDEELRLTAAQALLIMNNQDGLNILFEGLKSGDPFIRIKAVEILKGYQIVEAIEPLKTASEDEYINVSIGAIAALSKFHKKELQPIFEKLMDAPNQLVKISAATAYLKGL